MHRNTRVSLLVVYLGTTILSGCFGAGFQPRLGQTLKPGTYALGGNATPLTLSRTSVVDASGEERSSLVGLKRLMHPLFCLQFVACLGGEFRFATGVTSLLELDGHVGVDDLGVEMRLGMLDERAGDVVSAALGVGVTYRPLTDWKTLGLTAQLDMSRAWGSHVLILDAWLSWAPEARAMLVPTEAMPTDCMEFFGCASEYDAELSWDIRRKELRLGTFVGYGLTFDDDEAREGSGKVLMFGIAPYVAFPTSDAVIEWSTSTASPVPDRYESEWGVHFVMSFYVFG